MRHSHFLVCSLAVCILTGIAPRAIAQETNAETREKKKTGAAAYDDFKEPYRTQLIEKWKKDVENEKRNIENGKRELNRPPKGARTNQQKQAAKADRQRRKTSLEQVKQYLKRLEENDPPFIPTPDTLSDEPSYWRVGDIGSCGGTTRYYMPVVQIVGKDKMLVAVSWSRNSKDTLIMFSGFPTQRITDGANLGTFPEMTIQITGTTTCSTKTVLVAKPFDRDAYIKSLKREKP